MGEPESFVPESFATVDSCRGEGAGKMPLTLGVEYAAERSPHMERVQIVLDKDLWEAADKAARRMKQNRSALIRHALREHLKRLEALTREERDRAGYSRHPRALEETSPWETEAAWPAE